MLYCVDSRQSQPTHNGHSVHLRYSHIIARLTRLGDPNDKSPLLNSSLIRLEYFTFLNITPTITITLITTTITHHNNHHHQPYHHHHHSIIDVIKHCVLWKGWLCFVKTFSLQEFGRRHLLRRVLSTARKAFLSSTLSL